MSQPHRPKLAVVMDPISSIHYKKDTTLGMLWAAARAGYELFYMEIGDLLLRVNKPYGRARALSVSQNPDQFYQLGEICEQPLADFDVILMRKDPPFDMAYIYATYLLELTEQDGTLVVNRPQSLRDCNEKLFACQFAECAPPLVVSSCTDTLRAFHAEHRDIILKPLDGMGGSAVFRVKEGDGNLGVIIETLTSHGSLPIMAQRYLPAIKEGDKRILMIDGKPVDYCVARIPMAGENRGNLAAGGSARVQPLSQRDREIAAIVGPELLKRGLYFVGLDVIGDYLTEINVTSPTCLREIETETGLAVADQFIAVISRLLAERRSA